MSADHDDQHPRRLRPVPTTITVGLNEHSPGHAELTGVGASWSWIVVRDGETFQIGQGTRRSLTVLDALDALTQWRGVWQNE